MYTIRATFVPSRGWYAEIIRDNETSSEVIVFTTDAYFKKVDAIVVAYIYYRKHFKSTVMNY